MIFRSLPLAGAFEVTLERHADSRGFFARFFCADAFSGHGLNTSWVQMNLSFSVEKGTLRGLHFQRPPMGEAKLVRCLRGLVLDVIVDLRAGSSTFGQHCTVELSEKTRNSIYVPVGFAHGFQTLTGGCELQYLHSVAYAPEAEGGVAPFDADLAIDWPLPAVQVSDRDLALPALKELAPL
jgi:dTDP-4-dehydrorhamnose 3,5-epimerase